MSIGNFPEILSQAILVGIILVGRLGAPAPARKITVPPKGGGSERGGEME